MNESLKSAAGIAADDIMGAAMTASLVVLAIAMGIAGAVQGIAGILA